MTDVENKKRKLADDVKDEHINVKSKLESENKSSLQTLAFLSGLSSFPSCGYIDRHGILTSNSHSSWDKFEADPTEDCCGLLYVTDFKFAAEKRALHLLLVEQERCTIFEHATVCNLTESDATKALKWLKSNMNKCISKFTDLLKLKDGDVLKVTPDELVACNDEFHDTLETPALISWEKFKEEFKASTLLSWKFLKNDAKAQVYDCSFELLRNDERRRMSIEQRIVIPADRVSELVDFIKLHCSPKFQRLLCTN